MGWHPLRRDTDSKAALKQRRLAAGASHTCSLLALVGACAAIFILLPSAQAAGRQYLTGHVPQAIAESKVIGRVPPDTRMNLAIGLPWRNQEELETFLKQLSDPQSPNYRQYLTSAQFAERFGPSNEDYQGLADFLRANGLAVTATHPNRMILDVSGTVADIEATFHLNMFYWSHPTRGTFFAPDREPSLDAGVTILDITGLDNFFVPRPMDLKSRLFDGAEPLNGATPLTTGSGPAGLFVGNDFRAAYAPAVSLNGAGQSIGLFELDGFYASDVQANFKQAGLAPVPVETVLLDGFKGTPGSGNVEVTLDIMMAAYMAPGASNIIVYEGTNWNDVLNRMATDNLASVLSSSWCFSPTNSTTEQIFEQMIAQGQSLFQASGDSGAYGGPITPPADDPNLTVVGGTSLTTAGPGGAWQSETAWSYSGGGVSTVWPIPSYQQSVNMTAAGGSETMRNIPDVALIADLQIFLICNNGQWQEIGGTSAAAPLWAGFIALANQQAAANRKPQVGFLNPAIYGIGDGANYQSDLHDIFSGNNGGFNALPGYDLATGWGTPAGQSLIDSLTATSSSPAFSVSSSSSAFTVAPGASATSTITISPQQGFSGTVTLTATGLPTGVTASFSPARATTTSTLTLVASSSVAPATTIITITGTSGSLTSTTRIALTVTSAASFSISATPASVSLAQGGSSASTIAINSQNGFSGAVSLAASGLPTGVAASFSPIGSAGTSTLTLSASGSTATGSSTITITGTSGSLSSSVKINLTVSAARGFTIAASPTSLSIPPGSSGATIITVAPVGSFNSSVGISVNGLPSGITSTLSQATTTRITTLTLRAASNAAPGTWPVTVIGTAGTVTSSATISVTVPAVPSFTLSATPASVILVTGGNATSTIAINAQNGFSGAVAFTASGLPAGVAVSFNPATAGQTSVATFTASSTASAATATVTIMGTSGALTSKTSIALAVTRPPAFTLSASPSSLSVPLGASANSTVTLTPQNGFSGLVTLSLSGLPAGVIGSFSAGSSPSSCVLTLTATASAAKGQSTVTITGKSSNLIQTATVAITVLPASSGTASVNMAAAYNVMSAVTDGARFLSTSGLDGGGRAYSGTLLGSAQNVGGSTFRIGPSNGLAAVSGATIALPAGNYSTLTLLATAVNGNQPGQKFVVTYTDGSSTSFTQSLSDWCTPQGYTGESSAVTMPYRNNSNGTRDNRPITLYGYTFNLSNNKIVKSITLPGNRNVVVLAMNLSAAASSTSDDGMAPDPAFSRTHIILYPGTARAKR